MTNWRVTPGLIRSVVVAAAGLGFAVLAGEPALMVLASPFALLATLGIVHRPRTEPRVTTRLDHATLHEGQGTMSRLVLDSGGDVEHVTRVSAAVPYVATRPVGGVIGRLVADGSPELELSPRRWGRRMLGEEKVGLHTRWAGYRWGPVPLGGQELRVAPVMPPFDSRAEVPHPIGLVGAHRARRAGGGSEFAGIRGFQPGDRLRRINWRISLRTDALHVQTMQAEEDSGVLLLVDALADHGRSGGIDGVASSLDLTVRAAAAIAEHHLRQGDRVGLRVVGRGHEHVGLGSGVQHLRVLLGSLAALTAGEPKDRRPGPLQLGVTGGTVVIVLSAMLSHEIAAATALLLRRGLSVLVIDTLPDAVAPGVAEGADPVLTGLAWRMRRLEREQVLGALATLGCPVVPWRGSGTLDAVLSRLARRAQLPQVRRR